MYFNCNCMPIPKLPSIYDLFKGRFEFTNEPLWFRIIMWSSLLAFYLALALILAKYTLPALCLRWLTHLPGMKGLLNGKSRLP